MASARLRWATPPVLFAIQLGVLVLAILVPHHPLAQDAPRLLAIERVRRSLEAEGTQSPFHPALALDEVPFARPYTLWMTTAAGPLGERWAQKAFMAGTTVLFAAGFWYAAAGMRRSRRWAMALVVPVVFHRAHYLGFLDYSLGLAAIPWAVGAVLRIRRDRGRREKPILILGGAALLAGMSHVLATIPFALVVGLFGALTVRWKEGRIAVTGAALLAPALAVGLPFLTAAGPGPTLRPLSWPSTINAFGFLADSLDPAAGVWKAVTSLALLGAVMALAGTMRTPPGAVAAAATLDAPPSPFRRRRVAAGRSLGGPLARRLLLCAAAVLGVYLLFPSRMGPISQVSYRFAAILPFLACFALPARRGPRLPGLLVSLGVIVVATLALHGLAARDQARLAAVAPALQPRTWVMPLPPNAPRTPTFSYLSPFFQIDEAAVLDAITAAGALTPTLYIPPRTFPLRYVSEHVPMMWQAGTTNRWSGENLGEVMKSMDAILFMGMTRAELEPMLRRGGAEDIVAGENWVLWRFPR